MHLQQQRHACCERGAAQRRPWGGRGVDSACYFRVPSTLHPQAVGDQDVIFEVAALIPAPKGASNCKDNGASMGRAAGLVRWLLCYASTGSRHLKWAKNEMFTL